MSIKDLLRRLDRIEAAHCTEEPKTLVAFIPLKDELLSEIKTDWREMVRDGRASIDGHTLYIRAPELTTAEWVARTARQRSERFH